MDNTEDTGLYSKVVARRLIFVLLLMLILIFGAAYSITLGIADISITDAYAIIMNKFLGSTVGEYSSFAEGVIFKIRLPRVLLSIIAGLVLGSTGAVMQSILKNPLASPYTLGVSAGAAFGAGLLIVLGHLIIGGRIAQYSSWAIIVGAFLMGVLTILIINGIASFKGGGTATLILAGVALSYFFSAGISFFKYIADHDQLQELTVWLMGGLYKAEWIDILILTPITFIGLFLLLKLAWDINVLNVGEEVAANLGVDVYRVRRNGSVIAAFLTSCVVAFTGIIGFIGLVAPHICRMIIGNDNRFLILASGIMGGIFLLGADTIARIIISPAELPVGIITSLIGAPFFLYMLIKKRRSYWV